MARLASRWMLQHSAGVEHAPTGLISTLLVQRFYTVFVKTHETRSIGLVIGPSGVGKSIMAKATVAGLIPGSVHVELSSGHCGGIALIQRIAQAVGMQRVYGTKGEKLDRVVAHLKGSGRLLLIDEAFYLNRDGLNIIRDIHKLAEVPIVLLGTEEVLEGVNDWDQYHGQWTSLVSLVFNVTHEMLSSGDPLFSVEEVQKFAKSHDLRLTGDGAEWLTRVANELGFGGLRKVRMVLISAAALSKGKAIDAAHVRKALRAMHGAAGWERIAQRLERVDAPRRAAAG